MSISNFCLHSNHVVIFVFVGHQIPKQTELSLKFNFDALTFLAIGCLSVERCEPRNSKSEAIFIFIFRSLRWRFDVECWHRDQVLRLSEIKSGKNYAKQLKKETGDEQSKVIQLYMANTNANIQWNDNNKFHYFMSDFECKVCVQRKFGIEIFFKVRCAFAYEIRRKEVKKQIGYKCKWHAKHTVGFKATRSLSHSFASNEINSVLILIQFERVSFFLSWEGGSDSKYAFGICV